MYFLSVFNLATFLIVCALHWMAFCHLVCQSCYLVCHSCYLVCHSCYLVCQSCRLVCQSHYQSKSCYLSNCMPILPSCMPILQQIQILLPVQLCANLAILYANLTANPNLATCPIVCQSCYLVCQSHTKSNAVNAHLEKVDPQLECIPNESRGLSSMTKGVRRFVSR